MGAKQRMVGNWGGRGSSEQRQFGLEESVRFQKWDGGWKFWVAGKGSAESHSAFGQPTPLRMPFFVTGMHFLGW